MNNKPQQLRLAASILETGHPWEVCSLTREEWRNPSTNDPVSYIVWGHEIRPALATPPYGATLHNPGNLTAEQVGVGYRLTIEGEPFNHEAEKWYFSQWVPTWDSTAYSPNVTYRLPLSVPWPPALVDPYAELKAAPAAGKVIQFRSIKEAARGDWSQPMDMLIEGGIDWGYPTECFRIKPEKPAFQLPPPPPGMQWHRADGWREGDLPQGYRPHILGEESGNGSQQKYNTGWVRLHSSVIVDAEESPMRTTRPLIFTHEGKQWTYHRPGDPMPGDPMPCDGEALIEIICETGKATTDSGDPLIPRRASHNHWHKTIGWRYAEPETKKVQLDPEDVPPGSVFRLHDLDIGYESPCEVAADGVTFADDTGNFTKRWAELQGGQINRSVPLTGKWNPNAWEPCHKTITLP